MLLLHLEIICLIPSHPWRWSLYTPLIEVSRFRASVYGVPARVHVVHMCYHCPPSGIPCGIEVGTTTPVATVSILRYWAPRPISIECFSLVGATKQRRRSKCCARVSTSTSISAHRTQTGTTAAHGILRPPLTAVPDSSSA